MRHILLIIVLFVAQLAAPCVSGQTLDWARQFGTVEQDFAQGVAADQLGNVYVLGDTEGNLARQNEGRDDVFLRKFDAQGELEWSRQFGSDNFDQSQGIAADGRGNVYVTGGTHGDLAGSNLGLGDAFLSKYAADGTILWAKQFGTPGGEYSYGVTTNRLEEVFVAGNTSGSFGGPNAGSSDPFVAKFDANGELLWKAQYGTPEDERVHNIAADALGNTYVAGYVVDANYEAHGFLSKYDSGGTQLWTQSIEGVQDVATNDAGDVYAGGLSRDESGWSNVYIEKLDGTGTTIWRKSLDSGGREYAAEVTVDLDGNVYFAGSTDRSLGGPHAGRGDVLVGKLDPSGNQVWLHQFGSSNEDAATSVAIDGIGGLYTVGYAGAALPGNSHAGGWDAILARYSIGAQRLPGDTDLDGDVDLNDLNNVRNNFGSAGSGVPGDVDDDQDVDLEDLNLVRNHFGDSATGRVVPEPTTALLALLGFLAMSAIPDGSAQRRRMRAELMRLRRCFCVRLKWVVLATMILCHTSAVATGAQLFDLGGNSPEFVAKDGSAVAGYDFTRPNGQNSMNVTRWTPETGVVDLGDIPGTPADQPHFERALGGSFDASVIVGMGGTNDAPQAYRWTAVTGMVGLGALGPEQYFEYASATTADGSAIYGLSYGQGFRWTEATGMTTTTPVIGRDFVAVDATDDGSMLVGGDSVVFSYSGYWTENEGFVELTLPDYWLEVDRVSRDGGAISGIAWKGDPADRQGFRWTPAGGVELLERVAGVRGFEPSAMSRDGNVIVGAAILANTSRSPYVWSNSQGMQSFRNVLIQDHGLGVLLNGWNITAVTGMDESGRVFAGDAEKNGQYHGFVLQLDRPMRLSLV